MEKQKSVNIYKNLLCASVGLLIIFVTSIFVAKDFFGKNIESLVDEATLLKDYHYPVWGQFPGKIEGTYTHTLKLYNFTNTHPQPTLPPLTPQPFTSTPLDPIIMNYQFSFKKVSFGQGNQGFIKYLHEWDRKWKSEQSFKDTKISMINLAAQKVYDYQLYATQSRKFVVMYNQLQKLIINLLPNFYAQYLHQYYLHDYDVVNKVIFDMMQLPQQKRKLIYSHSVYGWEVADNLKVWVQLCHSNSANTHPAYERLLQAFGLTELQLNELIGPKSILHKLSTALNGTIKYKAQSNIYKFQLCNKQCDNSQIAAIQMSTGSITSSPLFATLNLNKYINDLNITLPNYIQYSRFCKAQEDMRCVDDKNVIGMFFRNNFGSFAVMNQVFQYSDNYPLIQSLFGVKDPMQEGEYGRSIMQYIKYLQNNVFTVVDQDSQTSDKNSYKYVFVNNQYISSIVENMKNVIIVELYTRALLKQFADDKVTCEQFFTGSYSGFVGLCKKEEFQLNSNINALRTYVKAYLFMNRAVFINQTAMTNEQAYNFLRLDKQKSALALYFSKIGAFFKESFECPEYVCTKEYLAAREWGGDKPILQNLPKQYFPEGKASLLQWDIDNNFNRKQPQYYKLTGQIIPIEDSLNYLSSGPKSILVIYNLMKYKLAADKGDVVAAKLMNYVQKVVIDSGFGGAYQIRPVSDIVNGYSSKALNEKRAGNKLVGGASWLPSSVALIETKHRPQNFNKINTGIYSKDLIRKMLQVDQSSTVGSSYITYQTQQITVSQQLKSTKTIFGTNMLGFHQDIGADQMLTTFIDPINMGVTLTNIDKNVQFEDKLTTYKYSINQANKKVFNGIQQQNERSVIINPQSYLIVDPTSGNTLQLSIKYSISSKLSFLDYYYSTPNPQINLFDMQIFYNRNNIDDLVYISDMKWILSTIYIVVIVLAGLSVGLMIFAAVMYRIRSKAKRSVIVDSLISSNKGSSNSIKV